MRVKLADEVVARKTLTREVRPALHANKCDGCGKIFAMSRFSPHDERLGDLYGTFEDVATGADGRSLGNMFSATVCSFACAHEVFALGGWRRIQEYKPYADAKINLARMELKLTRYVLDESQIRSEWEKIDNSDRDRRYDVTGYELVSKREP